MALVVFLRGVNVGGHRTFRPTVLARELAAYDVVNVGAAGTFVVRKPGPRAAFRAALLRALPFETEVVLCDARDVARIVSGHPFGPDPPPHDVVWFVTILSKAGGVRGALPVALPSEDEWLVQVTRCEGQFVFGMYRRHLRTIRYLGEIDKLLDVPSTTRNWNTISAVARILQGGGAPPAPLAPTGRLAAPVSGERPAPVSGGNLAATVSGKAVRGPARRRRAQGRSR